MRLELYIIYRLGWLGVCGVRITIKHILKTLGMRLQTLSYI